MIRQVVHDVPMSCNEVCMKCWQLVFELLKTYNKNYPQTC